MIILGDKVSIVNYVQAVVDRTISSTGLSSSSRNPTLSLPTSLTFSNQPNQNDRYIKQGLSEEIHEMHINFFMNSGKPE
jgi:hypothetical protein